MVFCFWPNVIKVEKKIEAEGREFTKDLRSLENFVLTVKQFLKQNTFWTCYYLEISI